jgi:D-alanyl-D-alanine carboxypeptidase/D-alanyl-D-alanine-endopeptidase (penicillin-binding protein 4)
MQSVKNNVRYKKRSNRSRGRKRVAFLALLCVAVVLFVALRSRTHGAPVVQAQAQAETIKHTVAVAKHGQAPAWGAASKAELDTALRSALSPGITDARAWSCVVLAQDGSVLFDDGGDRAVTPASVQKLVVSDAALTDLGPQFRFDTLFAAAQAPQSGTVDGNLWIEGSGDPSLRSTDLLAGARALHAAGIESVEGGVVVDGSALSGEEINPLWNADDANEDFMAATSGISVDEDTVEFDVTGTSPGSPADVRVRPQSRAVKYYGSVTTGGGDDVIVASTEMPNLFRLDGSVPAGVEEKFWVPVHGIPQYAGSVATALLRQGGVAVANPPQTGTVPMDASILWEHRSKPLPELLEHMLVVSDNHYAEQFMRTVGGIRGGVADDRSGIAAEKRVLEEQGIPTPGLHLVDGSGLAHANRIAAITLARILAHFDAQSAGNVLYPLLPRGGKDGTLKYYRFEQAAGRVRAKSGHLDDAASLAGYVETRKHGRVVFAFMINGSPGDPDAAIVSAVDRLAER